MKIEEQRSAYLVADAEGKAGLLASCYGVADHQMWKHKQSGKWIISHAGVQSIAAQEGIIVDYSPEMIERGFSVIMATPKQGDKGGQATFGEASPDNCQMKYYTAMAEKRAYDRAVLIFVLQSVGGHGADFYSEEESADFAKPSDAKPPKKAPDKPAPTTKGPTMPKDEIMSAIEKSGDLGQVKAHFYHYEQQAKDEGWIDDLTELCSKRRKELEGK